LKKLIICLFMTLGFSLQTMAHDETAPGYYLYKARVEAQTCSMQIQMVLSSIEKHQSGIPADSEICFDIGSLFTYLKDLDMAVDLASEDLKSEPWETRYNFRLPFRERDNLLGACGVIVDPTMPVGDYEELQKRLLKVDQILQSLY